MTATTATLETALCVSLAQIVGGDAPCGACDQPATVTIATGADPEPDPLCWTHARSMIDAALHAGDRLF